MSPHRVACRRIGDYIEYLERLAPRDDPETGGKGGDSEIIPEPYQIFEKVPPSSEKALSRGREEVVSTVLPPSSSSENVATPQAPPPESGPQEKEEPVKNIYFR